MRSADPLMFYGMALCYGNAYACQVYAALLPQYYTVILSLFCPMHTPPPPGSVIKTLVMVLALCVLQSNEALKSFEFQNLQEIYMQLMITSGQ